jgi:thiol-disulfide isomerase/thioredoxin
VVTLGTVVMADAVALSADGRIPRLAGVAALGLIASLVHQLVRTSAAGSPSRWPDTLIGIVVGCGAACLLALGQLDGGREVLLLGFAAAGAVLLVGRLGDRFAPSPVLAQGATRGWPGLVLGLVAGVLAALLVASLEVVDGQLPLRSAALLGLVVASTVATADLAVDLGAAELRAGWRDARRVAALRPTALLLPYALLGPVALLAGRLVLPDPTGTRNGKPRLARHGVRPVMPAPRAPQGPSLQPLLAELGRAAGERATLLQFSSAFCAPCRSTRRVLSEVAGMVSGVVHVELDAEHSLDLVRRLGIATTPTTIVLDADGREVLRAEGQPRTADVVAALGHAVP